MRKPLLIIVCLVCALGVFANSPDTVVVKNLDTTIVKKKNWMDKLGGDGFYLRDSTWHIGGFIGFNLAQTALYQWGPGGTNSFSFLANVNFYTHYKKGKLTWDNNLDIKYGMVANGEIRTAGLADRNFQKNMDILQFASNVGHDITDHLYFSGKVSFLSQFSPTYDYSQTDTADGRFRRYVVSRFAAPAYVTVGPGLTWKPKDYFTMFFTPIEGKFTFVSGEQKDTSHIAPGEYVDAYYNGVDPTRFGLQAGTNYSASVGAEVDILFQKDIIKNVNWKSHLNVYESYYNNNYNTIVPYLYTLPGATSAAQDSMGTKTIAARTQHIPTATWDNDIVFKINKILTAILSTRFVYQYNAATPVISSNGLNEVDVNGKPVLTYNKLQVFEQFGLGLAVKL